MSERPFMQLYVSDFLGDTLHLSTEQVGAYLLLLMAMWNAGGELPNDEAKLARIVRMSAKKWRTVAADLMVFFNVDGGAVRHNRLAKELRKSEGKSQSRASAGARGGAAKALKDKQQTVAFATDLPWHSPDTISQKKEPTAQHPIAAAPRNKYERLQEQLCEAAGLDGFRAERNVGLLNLAPIIDLIERGYVLEVDILPVLREIALRGVKFNTWNYCVKAVVDRAAARNAIPMRPQAPSVDWPGRLAAFNADGTWIHAWGPQPGEPGCRAPAELIQSIAA